jgi:hypothetical protein
MPSPFSGSLEPKGFSLSSFGRKDSVEPLFFSDLGGGPSFSVNRASSICRLAICPLRSSSWVFHSGTDLHSVLRASNVEKLVAIVTVCLVGIEEARPRMTQERNGYRIGFWRNWRILNVESSWHGMFSRQLALARRLRVGAGLWFGKDSLASSWEPPKPWWNLAGFSAASPFRDYHHDSAFRGTS